MIDKRFIERFLRLNEVDPASSEEEIRTVLIEARWAPRDVEDALIVLSGKDPQAEAALLQRENERAFRPDLEWSSTKLSSLLGIDVVVDPKSVQATQGSRVPLADIGKQVLMFVGIALVAVLFAGCVGVGVMYALEIGPFRAPSESIL